MLKSMRKHAKYFYFLFGIIILTFVFWGVGVNKQNGTAPLVLINGKERIDITEFWRAYDKMEDVYRDAFQDKFDDAMRDKLKLQVLEELVEARVLYLAARQGGITVTDAELGEAIRNDPSFIRNGRFNRQVYLNTLRLNHLTPAAYEQQLRQELMARRLRLMVQEAVDLTPAELKGLPEDPKLRAQKKETMLELKRQAALSSYVQGLKKQYDIQINLSLIA
jgi:parvulin-like peptidyl-prolyl isomerase